MESDKPSGAATISAKVPKSLLEKLDQIARFRCVSRSFLLRELAEAAVDGRVILGPSPKRQRMTVAELGASDVGAAARRRAQLDALAACRDAGADRDVGAAARDVGTGPVGPPKLPTDRWR